MSDRLFPVLDFTAEHVASGNTDIYRDGVIIAANGGGAHFQGVAVYFGLHIGEGLRRWTAEKGIEDVDGPLGIGGNDVACAINGTLIAIARRDPPRTIVNDGRVFQGFVSPAIDDTGRHLALLRHDDGALFLDGDPVLFNGRIVTGCTLPAFGGTSLMAELGDGRVIAIADCDNPALVANPEVFSYEVPLLKPHPVWVQAKGVLAYSCHTNDALLLLLWGQRLGWLIARGELDQGFHDARSTRTGDVRLVWSQRGVLGDWTQPLNGAIDAIAAVKPSTPPPPPPDVPFAPAADGTPFNVEAMLRGSATAERDGVLWYRKGAPFNGDEVGAWLDYDGEYVGLLADTSTGEISNGRVNAMYFAKARLWMPLRGVSGWRAEYDAEFVWRSGLRTKEYVRVAMHVGRGRYQGVDVTLRHTYDPRRADPKNPKRRAGFLEYSYYDARGEVRWEEWQDDANGIPQLKRVTQPTPATSKEAFVPPLRPLPYGPIWSAKPTTTPTITIASYGRVGDGAKQGPAPFTWEGQARTTGGGIDRIVWRYRPRGASTWTTKEDDEHTTIVFTAPGVYEIGVDAYDQAGKWLDGTASQRLLTVDAALPAPTPDPQPLPDPPPVGSIQGRLRMESGRPRDDAGYLQLRSISEFDLIHRIRIGDEPDVVRRITRAVQVGARNFVRIFARATVLFDLHDGQPGYWEAADRAITLCNDAGLRVNLCICADTKDMPRDAVWAFVLAHVRRYKDWSGVTFQIVNEPGMPMQRNWSGATDPDLLALADAMAAELGHRDFSIGDPADGDTQDASAETMARCVEIARHCNIIVLHSSRKDGVTSVDERFRRWIDHMESFYDIIGECRTVNPNAWGWHDEPMGFAGTSPVEGHERETNAEAALAAELTAQMIGCGYTYHYISAQDDETPGLDLCGRIVPQLPADPSWHYLNDSWQGSPTRGFSGYGKVRHWTNGVEVFTLASGRNKGSVSWANGFAPDGTFLTGTNVDVWHAHV